VDTRPLTRLMSQGLNGLMSQGLNVLSRVAERAFGSVQEPRPRALPPHDSRPLSVAARIDAARDRLRKQLPPLSD